MAGNNIIENAITLSRLSDFKDECDNTYLKINNTPNFGLSISGHTISIVENSNNKSVTVPDSDTTYSAMSSDEGNTGTSNTERLISASELKAQILYRLATSSWYELESLTLKNINN